MPNGESAARCVCRGRHGARVMRAVVQVVGTVCQAVRARRGVPAVGGTDSVMCAVVRGALCLPWAARSEGDARRRARCGVSAVGGTGSVILAQFLKNCM